MIRVRQVSVKLGGRLVLDNVSFDVGSGEFLAVVGPNGGGKSTLLRAILGLVTVTHGVIETDFPDHRDFRPGYVPQIKTLDRTFPARAIDLVLTSLLGRWPGAASRKERATAVEALDRVGAAHLADLQTGTLSGGELQRVYLARALMSGPELLLLDEPETGIDSSGHADLHEVLDQYRRQTSGIVIMVTHDWDVACHHATSALLLKTRAISFGTPEFALSEPFVREAFGHVGHEHAVLGGAFSGEGHTHHG